MPSLADIDVITAACQDLEIQRWVPIPVPYTRREAEEYVTEYSDSGWATGKCCTWAIHTDNEFAGAIGLDGIGGGGKRRSASGWHLNFAGAAC